jgi:thiamine phosphate synthase YjbQ (UPF0047 family)
MAVHTAELRLSTRGDADVIDITGEIAAAVAESGIGEGQASAFVSTTTPTPTPTSAPRSSAPPRSCR